MNFKQKYITAIALLSSITCYTADVTLTEDSFNDYAEDVAIMDSIFQTSIPNIITYNENEQYLNDHYWVFEDATAGGQYNIVVIQTDDEYSGDILYTDDIIGTPDSLTESLLKDDTYGYKVIIVNNLGQYVEGMSKEEVKNYIQKIKEILSEADNAFVLLFLRQEDENLYSQLDAFSNTNVINWVNITKN